jgi:hypothetical protein
MVNAAISTGELWQTTGMANGMPSTREWRPAWRVMREGIPMCVSED